MRHAKLISASLIKLNCEKCDIKRKLSINFGLQFKLNIIHTFISQQVTYTFLADDTFTPLCCLLVLARSLFLSCFSFRLLSFHVNETFSLIFPSNSTFFNTKRVPDLLALIEFRTEIGKRCRIHCQPYTVRKVQFFHFLFFTVIQCSRRFSASGQVGVSTTTGEENVKNMRKSGKDD